MAKTAGYIIHESILVAVGTSLKNKGNTVSAKSKNIELVIHHISKAPKSVKAGCKKMQYNYHETKKVLKMNLVWDSAKESKEKIKL